LEQKNGNLMSQENEFDNAFKERVGNMNFEFNPAYWDEMSALLDSKQKKRGLLFWWISAGSVAAVLLLVGVVYFTGQESQKQWAGFVNENHETPLTHTNTETTETTLIERVECSRHENISRPAETKNPNSNPDLSMDNVTHHSDVAGTSPYRSAISSGSNTNASNASDPSRNTTNNVGGLQSGGDFAQGNNTNNAGVLANQNSSQRNREDTNQEETDNASSSPIFDNLTYNRIDVLSALPIQTQNADLAQFDSEFIKPRETFNSHVGIVAGTTFGRSLQTQDGAVGGLGSHLGLRFYFAGKNGFQVNTGLSFGVNQINGLVYEEHRKIFGYNQYDVVNTIKYQSMLTANVPIYLGYEGYRFSVAGGLRLNYIMNTKGRVYTWDNSVYDQSIWGYAHGIKYFNMALGFEATYQLARRWDLGMSFDIDLSSRSEENNDLISPEARLWQTGVFLKYRIN
jgi:hypothetical protein